MTVVSLAPARRPRFLRFILIPLIATASLLGAACDRQQQAVSTPGALSSADEKHAIEVLKAAPEHGFAPDAFPVEAIASQIESGDKRQAMQARRRLQQQV